jgi:membrane protein implicated in regulation of membrane protease activity
MSTASPQPKAAPEMPAPSQFWKVAAPVVLAGVLIIGAVIGMVLAMAENGTEQAQVSIVGDVMLICFGLCPLLLCSTLFYAIVVASIYGVNRLHRVTRQSLHRAETATGTLADKTASVADNLNRKSISISAGTAFLDHMLDQPESETEQSESRANDDH